jgi:hypothetical protein
MHGLLKMPSKELLVSLDNILVSLRDDVELLVTHVAFSFRNRYAVGV